MRLLLVLFVVLGACASKQTGPAWPKMAERETDGGESLAPRSSVSEFSKADAAKPDAESDSNAPADASAEAPAADADDDDGAEAESEEPSDDTSVEDVIVSPDEIVIEIDEDE